ncbi:MAG: glycyl-radical enzyme activating protein [Anaerolineales bacterium]|nr:glycyl-radical enzyme activating protein [Anaerolineales bacterium]
MQDAGDPGGIVFDIKRFAVHDGPGIRTTIYLKGCPLSCIWCHNPEGQSPVPELVFREKRCIHCGACLQVCPQDADMFAEHCVRCGRCVEVCPTGAREQIGRWMANWEIIDEIEKDIAFFDESGGGVTFSGGEPFGQPEALGVLLRACKEREIHTTVDTSGLVAPQILAGMIPYIDLFLYDLKLMDDDAHRQYTGVSNRLILENLRFLSKSGKRIIVRVPIIPGITDHLDNLEKIGSFLADLDSIRQVDILRYHQMAAEKYCRLRKEYKFNANPPSAGQMEYIANILKGYGLTVTIGG